MKFILITRKPSKSQFSMEKLFSRLYEDFMQRNEMSLHQAPFTSQGTLRKVFNTLSVMSYRNQVLHIFGDVTYMSLFINYSNKLIVTFHDTDLYTNASGFRRWLYGLFWYRVPLKRASRVTCISEHTRRNLIKYFSPSNTEIIVIPNPNTIENTYPYKSIQKNRNIRFIHIGTKANKNLEGTIKVLNSLSGMFAVSLTIVGEPTHKELSLSNEDYPIDVISNITEKELVNKYIEADILLFLSKSEGFGLPILEAQKCGTYVVTSNKAPMVDIVGKGGIVVDIDNYDNVIAKCVSLIVNEDLQNSLAKKAKKNVELYSLSVIKNKYDILYKELR